MTREEAIKIFNTVLFFGKCDCPKEEIEECLKMAIKALEQEPTTKNDLGVDCIDRNSIKYYSGQGGYMYASKGEIDKLPSVTPQEPILEKINKMKSEIADSLEFWDYSPNNNPLARDMLETITNFWGDIHERRKW